MGGGLACTRFTNYCVKPSDMVLVNDNLSNNSDKKSVSKKSSKPLLNFLGNNNEKNRKEKRYSDYSYIKKDKSINEGKLTDLHDISVIKNNEKNHHNMSKKKKDEDIYKKI